MSKTKLARFVVREAQKRLEGEVEIQGGIKNALKVHLCDSKEDLMELFMFNVGEEFVVELENLCNL